MSLILLVQNLIEYLVGTVCLGGLGAQATGLRTCIQFVQTERDRAGKISFSSNGMQQCI